MSSALPSPAGTLGVQPGAGAPGPSAPLPPRGGPPQFGGFPANAIPGNAGFPPEPAIMPPDNFGPQYDPLGMGPPGGFGPPPGPMYPPPGPYGAQLYQPAPPMPTVMGPGSPDGEGGQSRRAGFTLPDEPRPRVRVRSALVGRGRVPVVVHQGADHTVPPADHQRPNDAGLLGAASTSILVGDHSLGFNAMNGLRIGTGFFGDDDRRFGFQMYGFIIERASNIQNFGSLNNLSGIPVLARPFIDATTGVQNTLVLSGPDFGPSTVQVGTNTQTWGISPEGVWNLYRTQPGSRLVWSFDLTAGYRYIYEKEELWVYSRTQLNTLAALPQFQLGPFGTITQLPAIVGTPVTTLGGEDVGGPATIEIRDRINAVNQFNGFVIGFKSDARYGMITTSMFGKIAIGDMHERVEMSGGNAFFDPTGHSGSNANTLGAFPLGVGGGAGSAVGGLLINSNNVGTFVQDKFTYIPEVGLNVGIALTKSLSGYIGGNFLYFPNIVRPGNLINPVVSSAAVPFSPGYGAPGAPRSPGFQFVETDRWLGGLTWGLILKY